MASGSGTAIVLYLCKCTARACSMLRHLYHVTYVLHTFSQLPRVSELVETKVSPLAGGEKGGRVKFGKGQGCISLSL